QSAWGTPSTGWTAFVKLRSQWNYRNYSLRPIDLLVGIISLSDNPCTAVGVQLPTLPRRVRVASLDMGLRHPVHGRPTSRPTRPRKRRQALPRHPTALCT